MPRIYSRTQKIHKKFLTCTQPFFEDAKNREVYEPVRKGKNTYLRVDRTQTTDLDLSWVKRIEDCVPQLGQITTNPKKVMQIFSEVVAVEKAKKITAESVVHLASHTQFVKTVDEHGNVTPNKILNIYNDDNIKMYENKFIATLIRRLTMFVEKRYDFILNNAKMEDVSMLYYKNETEIDSSKIEIETRVRFTKPADESDGNSIQGFLKRINEIRKYLRYFGHTEFMKIMHSERDIRNPILQTNIIRKNPIYRKCYHLWQFLDTYTSAGVQVRVKETVYDLDDEQIENINKSMFVDYITLRAKDNDSVGAPKYKTYSPKIIKTLDDDVYTFASLYDGPVDYVRVDDKYREFAQRPKEVPEHPTKAEQKYFKEEYQHNREVKENSAALDALIKRREQEASKYLKETAELLDRQKKEAEAARRQAELDRIRAQEQRIEDARSLLVAAAERDFLDEPEDIETMTPPVDEDLLEEEIVPEIPVEEEEPPIIDDEETDENFVLPDFASVYGKDAENELFEESKDSVHPLDMSVKKVEEEEEEMEFNADGEHIEETTVEFDEDAIMVQNPEDDESLSNTEEFDFDAQEFSSNDEDFSDK